MNSEVKVSKFDIDGAGDKGVSAGENSSISLENGEIKNTEIGIAVKDASKVKTEGLRLIKNQIGIDLYVKHKLYGYPGRVFIAKTEFGANEVNVRSEAGANLFVRGQSLPSKMTGDGLVKLVAADGAK